MRKSNSLIPHARLQPPQPLHPLTPPTSSYHHLSRLPLNLLPKKLRLQLIRQPRRMRLPPLLRHMHIPLSPAPNMMIRILLIPQRLGGDNLLIVALCGCEAGRADVGDAAAAGAVGAVAVVAG